MDGVFSKPTDYPFFDESDSMKRWKQKWDTIHDPPYCIHVIVSNFANRDTIELKTDHVLAMDKLPQSIRGLVETYGLMRHGLHCFVDKFFFHFRVRIQSNQRMFEQIFMVNVGELRRFAIEHKIKHCIMDY